MSALDPVVAGDINVTRARMLTEFGTLEDGTGGDDAVVVAHIWRGTVDPVELECDVDDGEACQFTILFGEDEYGWLAAEATAGIWQLQYQATFSDGTVLTAPALWPDSIMVSDQHDPEA